MYEYYNGCGDEMRLSNKHEILRHYPGIASSVLEVWGMKLFIYFDLVLLSVLLGFILYPAVPVFLAAAIPAAVLISFICIYRLLCRKFPDKRENEA